jgi:hypothetical protein
MTWTTVSNDRQICDQCGNTRDAVDCTTCEILKSGRHLVCNVCTNRRTNHGSGTCKTCRESSNVIYVRVRSEYGAVVYTGYTFVGHADHVLQREVLRLEGRPVGTLHITSEDKPL